MANISESDASAHIHLEFRDVRQFFRRKTRTIHTQSALLAFNHKVLYRLGAINENGLERERLVGNVSASILSHGLFPFLMI